MKNLNHYFEGKAEVPRIGIETARLLKLFARIPRELLII